MNKPNYKLVEVLADDVLPGRVVTIVNPDDTEVSFPVYNGRGRKLALVPAQMMEVFLACFPLGE